LIKEMSIQDLRSHSVEILSRTFLELGQNPNEDTIVSMSLILAEDLQKDFKNLEIEDIKAAFRRGIRETDEFHITVKTYYKWIKTYRNLLWDAEYQVKTQGADPKLVPLYKPQQKLLK
tara:strand:- start:2280 stop:2633 length:354 start_codon:yes stop_codon:yes gene_type:complete